jgi:hypothetical protein
MDIFVALVAILVGVAMLALIARPQPVGILDVFGAGFLPYRGAGWPRGVQEEDPVPWSRSAAGDPDAPTRGSGDGPHLIDIASGDRPTATAVDQGPMVRGPASRR